MSDKDKIDFFMFLDNYLEDAKEGFQAINSALLALEKDHSQTERFDEIFRTVHTLKSSSTMLEFSNIAELAHMSEDFLDRLRRNELPVTQEAIDLLFEIVDTLETMVRERASQAGGKRKPIEASGPEGPTVSSICQLLPPLDETSTTKVSVYGPSPVLLENQRA